jgi:hypothetical protein
MRCKHPFKKVNLQCLLTDLAFQFRYPAFRLTLFPVARKRLAHACPELPFPAVQQVRITSDPRATSAIDTPCSNRPTAANLNSCVNCLRDNPMTQFSVRWILSLNYLFYFWGPLQIGGLRFLISGLSKRRPLAVTTLYQSI